MALDPESRRIYGRIFALMAVCTVFLTLSFIGILAIVSGDISAPTRRLPWYLVIAAGAFVATIVLLEVYGAKGNEIIVTATITGIWAFVIVALSVEGAIYTIRHPEEVFVSQLVLYFLAAGLLGSGIAYWGLHHWREFTGRAPDRL